MSMLDARLHAFRDDLADSTLKGKVEAAHFTQGMPAQINVAVASVHKRPDEHSMQLTQGLFGDICQVFERRDGWAWVQFLQDGYVGYVRETSLGELSSTLRTHRVANVSTWHFSKSDLKAQPATTLYLNSEVAVSEVHGSYANLAEGGAIFAGHLRVISDYENDFVSVAERFLHTPYYWGGKTRAGIDCSGLVQVSLHACGIKAPRDSDMQENALGTLVNDHKNLQRGDFVFWPGHVGIMQSATQMIHSNGHFMMVTSEPLVNAIARSEKLISSVRRLSVNRPIPAAK